MSYFNDRTIKTTLERGLVPQKIKISGLFQFLFKNTQNILPAANRTCGAGVPTCKTKTTKFRVSRNSADSATTIFVNKTANFCSVTENLKKYKNNFFVSENVIRQRK